MMSTPTGSAAPIKPWWIGGAIVLALIAAGLFWFALRR
jgi:hypothetical protein